MSTDYASAPDRQVLVVPLEVEAAYPEQAEAVERCQAVLHRRLQDASFGGWYPARPVLWPVLRAEGQIACALRATDRGKRWEYIAARVPMVRQPARASG